MNILKNALTVTEAMWYQKHYPKHTVTRDLLEENGNTRIIVKGSWTPTGCARELHDCYIIAKYSRYDKLHKKSGNIIKDVEDKA